MKNSLIATCFLIIIVLLINSCEDKQGAVPLVVVPCGDTNKLTYSSDSNTMQAIINVQCGTDNSSCHSSGAGSGRDYSTYSGIYAVYQDGSLYQALFGTGSVPQMPKVQQPGWDQCVLNKFRAWIDLGCPQ